MSKLKQLLDKPIPPKEIYFRRTYTPSKQRASYIYDALNEEIFSNQLEKISLVLRPLPATYGWCHFAVRNGKNNAFIEVSTRLPCEQFFVAVLGHEMIHKYQWDVETPERKAQGLRPRLGHQESFTQWRSKFKEYNIMFGHYLSGYY